MEEPLQLAAPPSGLRTGTLDQPWRYAVRTQGKQMRVRVLTCAEFVARGGVGLQDERVTMAASGVEFMHLASMVHDDVADDGAERRGQPSLPATFGSPLAAASGGLFVGHALDLFARCGGETVVLASQAALRMCEGQMRELRSLYDCGRTTAEYYEAIEGKSAGMFWLASTIGGMLGGADQQKQKALEDYGEALGLGHQIIDDIDDVLQLKVQAKLPEQPHGNDLRNGNYTLPVIIALEECPELAKLLRADSQSEVVTARLFETRAIAGAAEQARSCITKARESVGGFAASDGMLAIADELLSALDGALR